MNNFIGAAQKRVAWLQTAVVLVPGLSAALGVDLVASAAGVCAWFALLSALWLLLCWFRPGKPAVTPQDLVRVLVDLRNAGIRRELGIVQGLSYKQIQTLPAAAARAPAFCAICLSEVAVGVSQIQLACSHAFHTECLEDWVGIKSDCPLCKQPVTPN